jgi:hypothetical protein
MEVVLGNIVGAHLGAPFPRYLIFYAVSSIIPKIKEFFQNKGGSCARLRVASQLGKRSIYIFELLHCQ